MRNLKRALSLTLASVMLLGMMVFGTSAASFTDADQITNETAATVLQELEVMQGSNGKFNPNQTVTRGQMAILICKMLYGSKLNADNFAGTSEFTDVPANAYYTGYVNLATQLGIISGYGNGKFGPGAPVTTAQAALMLTRALGWFQAGELENQNWTSNAIAAVEKATSVNLFGSMKLGNNEPLSRDNVCEMVFNAMTKTAPVNYNERWGTYYSDEGNVIQGVKFNYLNSLGYKNFTLVYNTTDDEFGRPSTEWGIGNGKLDGDNVDDHGNLTGSVTIRNSILKSADEADLTYTKDVKAKDIFADLGKPSNLGDVTVEKNGTNGNAPAGAFTLNNTDETKVGAKGSLTEVYKNNDNDVTIVVTDTYLVRATSDYNTKNEELSVVPYGVQLSSNKISNDDVTVSQFKKDDLILVTGVFENNRLVVKTAKLADKVENVKVSAYKANDYVTADKKYEYSDHKATGFGEGSAIGSTYSLQGTNYNLFLDEYGYVIAVDKYSDEVVLNDYLFVKEAARNGFNWQAKAVFMDGTEETITIAGTKACPADAANTNKTDNKGDSFKAIASNDSAQATGTALGTDGKITNGRFYLYNKKSNGEYELEDVANTTRQDKQAGGASGDKILDGGKVNPIATGWAANVPNAWLGKTANDDTIFIADGTLYTGVKNSPDVVATSSFATEFVYYLLDKDSKYLLAVYTDLTGVAINSTSEWVYILEDNGSGKDTSDKTYNIHTAIKDGEKDTDYHAKGTTGAPGLYEINTTEDGYPKLGTAIADAQDTDQLYTKFGLNKSDISYKAGVVTAGTKGLNVNDETVVYVVDVADKSANTIDASAVDGIDLGSYNVYAIYVSKSDKTVKTLWLAKVSAAPKLNAPSNTTVETALSEGPVEVTGTISGGTVTVDSGERLILSGTGTGTIALDGGTLELKGVSTMPTVSGSGKVEVTQDIAADIDNLKATSAPVAATAGDKGKVKDASSSTAKALDLSGAGKLSTYSNTMTMSQLAALTGSTTFKAMDFTLPTTTDATNVKLTYYTGSAEDLTQVAAGEWKSPNADSGVGAPNGRDERANEYDSDVTVTFYVGDKVTGLKFTITGSTNAGDYFFKIK